MRKKVVKNIAKPEQEKLDCSDVCDSDATANSSTQSIESNSSDTNRGSQLLYHDHQYSRISFYGSGMTDVNENDKPKKETKQEIQPIVEPAEDKPEPKPMPKLIPANVTYQLNASNIIQQTKPAFYIQNLIASTSTRPSPIPTVIRPIPQRNHRVLVTSPVPMSLNTPHNIWPRPIIQQPLYYIRFCEQTSTSSE